MTRPAPAAEATMIEPGFELKSVTLRTEAVKRAVQKASVYPAVKAALLVEREAKASMGRGGKMRMTKRELNVARSFGMKVRSTKWREPSAPGQPPNVQTGELKNSIHHARDGDGAVAGATAPYGKVHEQDGIPGGWAEFGGRRYPARPFMRPALERVARNFPQLWRNLKLKRHDTGT